MKPDEKINRKEKQEKIVDFRKIGAIIQKNFVVMTRDKIRLIPLLIFPIVMILVLGFTTGNAPKHIPTTIVIYDNSIVSQQIQQEISNSQTFSITHVVSTEGEAKKLLDNGDIRVIIEIPPNFEDDINNDIPAQITVIVDESDSAIAATANGELNVIINSVSARISQEKLQAYQQSVDMASQRLLVYTNTQAAYYDVIASSEADNIAAEKSIGASKSILDQYVNNLMLSMPKPSILVIPHNDTVQIFVNNHTQSTSQNFIVRESPVAQQIRSQASVLQKSSALMGSAEDNMAISSVTSKKSIQGTEKLQQSYNENVAQSVSTIRMFTHSKIENVMRPLVLENKPAYGTGKRAIDFLIPSLIALTLFQGAVMGMGRAVAGEKRDGSLTRVFLTPTSNVTIISGTIIFYVLFELVRAAFLIGVAIILFNTHIEGSILLMILILAIYVSTSIAIGMIISSLVKTEQQFMSMAMVVSLPTMFLAGAFFPVQAMPKVLQAIASVLPVTYAGEALRGVMVKGFSIGMIMAPLSILLLFLAVLLGGVFLVFKRNIE
jgi:ABC-2 type transport system permease protein